MNELKRFIYRQIIILFRNRRLRKMNGMSNEEIKAKGEETGMKVLYRQDLGDYDRAYIWVQESFLGKNYVVLVSLNGRTDERIFATFIEAKKFVKEMIEEKLKRCFE